MKMSWAAQNVGKGFLANLGRDIAKSLGLANWQQFTGHCWRRTAITWGANAGMTLSQLKAMSGHHSDTVVQVRVTRCTAYLVTNIYTCTPTLITPSHRRTSTTVRL
jgi:integrase